MPRYDRERRRRALSLKVDHLQLENRSTVTPIGAAAAGLGILSIGNPNGGMNAINGGGNTRIDPAAPTGATSVGQPQGGTGDFLAIGIEPAGMSPGAGGPEAGAVASASLPESGIRNSESDDWLDLSPADERGFDAIRHQHALASGGRARRRRGAAAAGRLGQRGAGGRDRRGAGSGEPVPRAGPAEWRQRQWRRRCGGLGGVAGRGRRRQRPAAHRGRADRRARSLSRAVTPSSRRPPSRPPANPPASAPAGGCHSLRPRSPRRPRGRPREASPTSRCMCWMSMMVSCSSPACSSRRTSVRSVVLEAQVSGTSVSSYTLEYLGDHLRRHVHLGR